MCSRAQAIERPTGDLNSHFHWPLSSFTVLCFINSALYFRYCSATVALFIMACDRCLEPGDKHVHTAPHFLKRLQPRPNEDFRVMCVVQESALFVCVCACVCALGVVT